MVPLLAFASGCGSEPVAPPPPALAPSFALASAGTLCSAGDYTDDSGSGIYKTYAAGDPRTWYQPLPSTECTPQYSLSRSTTESWPFSAPPVVAAESWAMMTAKTTSPLTITFDRPVRVAWIWAAGNIFCGGSFGTASARTVDGDELTSAFYPVYSTCGRFTPDKTWDLLATFPASAEITRITLIGSTPVSAPFPWPQCSWDFDLNEYHCRTEDSLFVRYSVVFRQPASVAPPELHLTCPAVTRGETGTCVASVTPEGTAFQTTAWRFEPADPNLPVVNRPGGVESHEWSGLLVAGGTVVVTATVGGATLTASAPLVVMPRNWEGKAVSIDILPRCASPEQLPLRPSRPQDLGNSTFKPVFTVPIEYASGPNEGYWYLTDVPARIQDSVLINCAAMEEGSEFWRAQVRIRPNVIGGTRPCTRADVLRLRKLVEAHEGLERDAPNSHAKLYMDEFERFAGPRLEPVVGPASSQDDVVQAVLDITAAAAVASGRIDDPASADNPFRPGCELQFTQPSGQE